MKWLYGFMLAASCPAATYYVDSLHGDDSRRGTSARLAWKTLAKVNGSRFASGDRILLKSGAVWQGQLAPTGSGITIDRYGKGPLPRIDGAGQVEDTVRLYNVDQIELSHLEITNHGEQSAVRRGVHLLLENFGTAHRVALRDLYIHDVNGTNKEKDNGGIVVRTRGDQTRTRFDGLTIERNIIWKVDRSAIAFDSFHWRRTRWFPSLNVVIRDNLVEDIGGDGIVPWATDGARVEHNIARGCNARAKTYNAGIWPWSTDNSLFQWNEASFTRTTMDGQGFDSDYNSRNTVFQYNYSHDNEGGFMLICSPGKRNALENVGNLGTVVRRNISYNDQARIIHLSAAKKTLVYENAIFVPPSVEVQMVLVTDWDGWADDAVIRDNRFYVEGKASSGHQVKRHEDGRYDIGPGWGPARAIRVENNREIPKLPRRAWKGPRFDPAHPEGFSRFLEQHRRWMRRLFLSEFGPPLIDLP